MYDIKELEKEWLAYRRKKVKKPIALSISAVAVAGLLFYLYNYIDYRKFTDKPKIQFTQNSTESVPTNTKPAQLETQVSSLAEKDVEAVKPAEERRKKIDIKITARSGDGIAKEIEKRFKYAKDKSDSLFLAKYYYDKNSYSEAERWALETNKLDSSIEEGWLIFAKSQAKQGRRIEALKVLQAFCKKSESHRAKELIDKIRRGKNF